MTFSNKIWKPIWANQAWNSVDKKILTQMLTELLVWYSKMCPAFLLYKITKNICYQNYFWYIYFGDKCVMLMSVTSCDHVTIYWDGSLVINLGLTRSNYTQSICLLTQPSDSPATKETKFIKLSIIIIFIACSC